MTLKDFIKIYKKCTAEPYSFLVNDTTLSSDDPLWFRKNLNRIIYKKIMTLEDQIRDEKLKYDINREAAKISALSSGKTSKYEYLSGEGILPSNQQQIIKQAKFTYSPLGKAFEKQIKTIENQGKKQIDALADLKPKEIKPCETKPSKYGDYFIDGLAKIRESYKPNDFNDLTYNFKNLKIPPVAFIKFKGPLHIFKSTYNGDTPLEDIEKEQIELKRDLGCIKQGD